MSYYRVVFTLTILLIPSHLLSSTIDSFLTYKTGYKNTRYTLAVQKCKDNKCKIIVNLVKNGKKISTKPVYWTSTPPIKITATDLDPSPAVGDPLAREKHSWFTAGGGEEGGSPQLHIRTVNFAKNKFGLLITSIAGYEHFVSYHELFYSKNGKDLELVWSDGSTSGGPIYVSTKVIHGTDKDKILYFRSYNVAGLFDDGSPDTWTQETLEWSSLKKKIIETYSPAYFAIVGSFKTVKEALIRKTELSRDGECLVGFLILKTDHYAKLSKNLFVIAAPSSEKALVTKALIQASKCNPQAKGYVKRVQ